MIIENVFNNFLRPNSRNEYFINLEYSIIRFKIINNPLIHIPN